MKRNNWNKKELDHNRRAFVDEETLKKSASYWKMDDASNIA